MLITPITLDVPLESHEDGSLRIAGTRILLEVLLNAYQTGDSAEEIVEAFPSLKLSDVYAVIAYYLAQPEQINEYLQKLEMESREIRQKIEKLPSYKPLNRETLLNRLNSKKAE